MRERPETRTGVARERPGRARRALGRSMTMPRQVAGRTYLISRPCTQRQFLLRPDETVNQIYLYCLGEAAQRYEMTLHGWMPMGNHQHVQARDNLGNFPAFLAHFGRGSGPATQVGPTPVGPTTGVPGPQPRSGPIRTVRLQIVAVQTMYDRRGRAHGSALQSAAAHEVSPTEAALDRAGERHADARRSSRGDRSACNAERDRGRVRSLRVDLLRRQQGAHRASHRRRSAHHPALGARVDLGALAAASRDRLELRLSSTLTPARRPEGAARPARPQHPLECSSAAQ